MTATASPDLAAMRVGLRQWFADLLGIDLEATHWRDEPRPAVVGACGMLAPIAIRELGLGEEQHAFDADAAAGEEIERAIGVPCVATLALTLDGYDQRLPTGVFFALHAARVKMAGADSIAALEALSLAWVGSESVVNLVREQQGRAYPRAAVDVALGFTSVEQLAAVGYVAHAELETEARDVDGELLPTPPNGSTWVPPLPDP